MPPIFYNPEVEADDIALLERLVGWNAVNDDIIDRNAGRIWKSSVAQEARDSTFFTYEPLGQSVELEGRSFSRNDGL